MSRETKLIKNTGIIAIGQLSSKLFSFLLLPLYTNVLLPDDFGVIDVLQAAISLIVYFSTLQMESAVFRYLIEERNNEKGKATVISSGMVVIILGNLVFTILSKLVNLFFAIPHITPFILSFWGLSFSGVMLNIARGNGKNTLYSIASFCITISFLLMNIIMIVLLQMGAVSILWSLCFSNITGGMVVFFKEKVYKKIKIEYYDSSVVKKMMSYSIPLIPNAISWWVANTSDRFIIIMFLGSVFNGIYAAANKIPTIYLTLFNVFNLAWTESIIVSIDDKDSGDYINKVFYKCFKLFSFVCIGLIAFIGLVFELLIGKEYYEAYNHILILLVAIFINSLCSLYGGIFSGYKDTKSISVTTIYGAVVNIVVNLFLVNLLGLYAASISTLVSYLIILFARYKYGTKWVKIAWHKEFVWRLIIILLIVSLCYFSRNKIAIAASLIGVLVWGLVDNSSTIKELAFFILKKKKTQEGSK